MPTPYEKDSNYCASHTSTADVNSAVLVARPCRFTGANYNGGGTARWIKLYDLATAPGTGDVPFMRLRTATSSVTTTPAPEDGIWLENGLAIRITANVADDDATAITAGEVGLRAYYKID